MNIKEFLEKIKKNKIEALNPLRFNDTIDIVPQPATSGLYFKPYSDWIEEYPPNDVYDQYGQILDAINFDYTKLYPNTQITHNIQPELPAKLLKIKK